MDLPNPSVPDPFPIPLVQLKVPTAKIPQYIPIVVPPSDLERPEGVEAEATDSIQEAPTVRLPVLDIEMPIPSGEVLVTAVTTAVVAVGTTTIAQSLFEPLKKQIQKQLQKQVDKWKEKRKTKKDSSKS